jgi:hypothetical protein
MNESPLFQDSNVTPQQPIYKAPFGHPGSYPPNFPELARLIRDGKPTTEVSPNEEKE